MLRNGIMLNALFAITLVFTLSILVTTPARAQSSQNIAYIDAQYVANGGAFPFSTNLAFSGFNFYRLGGGQVSTAALGPGGVCGASACDTVLLNAASYYYDYNSSTYSDIYYCNVNALSTQAKQDLVTFVQNGGKLVIYDSECPTQNYSWLPYPFTTSNPGAYGATGTVNIVEDNGLSDTDSTDPEYINASILGSNTDAVGDMNVMTTYDPNWCLDMSGTNVQNVTGPTHTYARYGNGLIIYNGFDVDYLAINTTPTDTTGAGNIAKIWLQELQVEFNPTPRSILPCGVTVVGITLTPLTATNNLSAGETTHTVTATLKDLTNAPQPNVHVTFSVVSGPNVGASGTCSANPSCNSDASGQVSFTYTSNGTTGTDSIEACFIDNTGQQRCSQLAQKEWVRTTTACDVDADGDIDINDIMQIFAARGQTVPPANPVLDTDGDGLITVNDARACVLQCTLPNCAAQ